MTQEERLALAYQTLENWLGELVRKAGKSEEYGVELWKRLKDSRGILREFAYYHDYGNFLCEYQVAGYTLADILVWQVDHFKAYLDRHEEVNRYKQEKLLLDSLDIMLQMEEDPAKSEAFDRKMRQETGTDYVGKF